MSFAYSVAIKLSVANLASAGIRAIAADLLAAHGGAVKLQEKLSALKMIAVGYGMEKLGSGIFGFLEKSVDASKEYTRQLSLMNAAGMSQKDIAESVASAWKTSKDVITTTAADNLKAIRELRSVLGPNRLGDVGAVLPSVQRVKSILEAVTGKEQEGTAFDVIKAVDLRTSGLMSKEAITRNADLMSRTIMAMGGTITANDFLMALKQSKAAALTYDDTFVYDYLPTLIQEVKTKGGSGSTAATALVSLTQAIVGGVVKKSAIPLWEQMGLVRPQDVVKNSTGQLQIRPGGVRDSALFQADPLKWFEQFAPVIEAYASKHKITVLDTVMGMFGNRNAQWIANTFIEKSQQFERDRGLIEASGSSSYDTYQKLLKSNPQVAEQALHAQYQNILALIGYQILPRLIPYMIKFADTLDGISQWMQNNPSELKTIVTTVGAIAVGMMFLGKVLMTAGILKFLGAGLIPLGVVGGILLGIAAAAFLLWKNWDTVGPLLENAWKAIRSAVDALGDWIVAKLNWVTNLFAPSAGQAPKKVSIHGSTVGHVDLRPHVVMPGTATASRFVAASQKASVTVYTTLNMDGRKVAAASTKHIVDFMKSQTGISGFDGSQALQPAGSGN